MRRTPRSAVLGLTVTLLTAAGPAIAAGPASAAGLAELVADQSTGSAPRPSAAPTLSAPTLSAPTPTVPTSSAAPTWSTLPAPGPDPDATAAVSDPSPLRGDRITVTGTGFTPGEKVTASLPSRNRGQLGSAVADPAGQVVIPVSVPATLPDGDQEVLLTGTSGERASTGFALHSLLADLLTRFIRWWPAD